MSKSKSSSSRERVRQLVAWGVSNYGQLGLSDMKERPTPTVVPNFESIAGFDCNGSHSIVLKVTEDKQTLVYAWGRNDSHQCGIASGDQPVPKIINTPTIVPSLSVQRIVQVACGGAHSAAVSASGKVFVWGWGDCGQLGLGPDVKTQPTPREVSDLDGIFVVNVSCGAFHTAFLTKTHSVYTTGMGTYGQLGHGDIEARFHPTLVEALQDKKIIQISCGEIHTGAVSSSGECYTWGCGESYQLGHGDRSNEVLPRLIEYFQEHKIIIIKVSCATRHTAAISHDGQVFTWGLGDNGELGHGPEVNYRPVPTLVEGLGAQTFRNITTSLHFTGAITDTGEVFSCGCRLVGAPQNMTTPSIVTILRKFTVMGDLFTVDMRAGTSHALAFLDSGDLHRNKVIGKIMMVEVKYVRGLHLLCKVISPVAETVVGAETWQDITGIICEIYKYHTKLLRNLRKSTAAFDPPVDFIDLWLALFLDSSLLQKYSQFATDFTVNWEKFTTCLRLLPGLGAYIERVFTTDIFVNSGILKTSKNAEQLYAFLQLPTLHFSELAPLFDELLKVTRKTHADYVKIKKVAKKAKECADMVTTSLNNRSMVTFLNFLKKYPVCQNLIQSHRRLLESWSCAFYARAPMNGTIYLFNDVVVITRESDVEDQFELFELFIKDLPDVANRHVFQIMTPLKSFNVYVENEQQKQLIISGINDAIQTWIADKKKLRDARILAGITLLVSDLHSIMPTISLDWSHMLGSPKQTLTKAGGAVAADVIRQIAKNQSSIALTLQDISDLLSKTSVALESESLRRERHSQMTEFLEHNEKFVVELEIAGNTMPKSSASLSRAFRRKKAAPILLTNLGLTSVIPTLNKNYRVAIRVSGDTRVCTAKEMLYNLAKESPWAASAKFSSLNDYVLRIKSLNVVLQNENLPLGRIPLIQTIFSTTFVTPTIEMVLKSKESQMPRVTLEPVLKTFEDITTLLGATKALLNTRSEEANFFRHVSAGFRLKLFAERNAQMRDRIFRFPEYKGLEPLPLQLPQAIIIIVYIPLLNSEKCVLQVSPYDTIAMINERIFRFVYKHEKHKGARKLKKFLQPLKYQIQRLESSDDEHSVEVEDLPKGETKSSKKGKKKGDASAEQLPAILDQPTDATIGNADDIKTPDVEELAVPDTEIVDPEKMLKKEKRRRSIKGLVDLMMEMGAEEKTLKKSGQTPLGKDQDTLQPPPRKGTRTKDTEPLKKIVEKEDIKSQHQHWRSRSDDTSALTNSASNLSGVTDEEDEKRVKHLSDGKPAKRARKKFTSEESSPEKETKGIAVDKNLDDASTLIELAETDQQTISKPTIVVTEVIHEEPGASPKKHKSEGRSLPESDHIQSQTKAASFPTMLLPTKEQLPSSHSASNTPESKKKRGNKKHERLTSVSPPMRRAKSSLEIEPAQAIQPISTKDQTTGEEKTSATNESDVPKKSKTKQEHQTDHDDHQQQSSDNENKNIKKGARGANDSPVMTSDDEEVKEQLVAPEIEEKRLTDEKKAKKEEERLRREKEREERRIKKEEERLRKAQEKEEKKAKKVHEKLIKKEGEKLRKEMEKGKKKQKHLPNGQTVDDFVLKVLGAKEFLLSGDPTNPNRICDYDYICKSINNGTPIELVYVEKASISGPPTASQLADLEDALVDEAIARDTTENEVTAIYLESGENAFRSAKPYWSFADNTTEYTVNVLDCENLELASDLRSRAGVYVAVGLYYGGQSLCRIQITRLAPASSTPKWSQEIGFGIPMCNLPREALLCFTVYIRPDMSKTKQRILKSDQPVAWVNCPVFAFDGIIRAGQVPLRLWLGDEPANPIGTVADNVAADNPTVLYVELFTNRPDTPNSTMRNSVRQLRTVGPTKQSVFVKPKERDATVEESEKLRKIMHRDTLVPLTEEEKTLLWDNLHWCKKHPSILPHLLLSVDWGNRNAVNYIHKELDSWPLLHPMDAITLLDYKYPDRNVRNFAVRCLEKISNNELYRILLQLTQALKYEFHHNSALAHFLIKRSFFDPVRVGQFFFWQLKSELHLPTISERFCLILESYLKSCGKHIREQLLAQNDVLEKLHNIAVAIKKKRGSLADKRDKLQKMLKAATWPQKFLLPSDPRIECSGFIVDKCRVLGSKTSPLFLAFENAETKEPINVIYKVGDDLRQDQLTLQLIMLMDDLWKREGVDLKLKTYTCLALGDEYGLIEVVKNANTTSNINIELGGLRAVYNEMTLVKWLRKHNPTEKQYQKAVETFIASCAGYSVITFVLGLADRHNDNIMLTKQGNLFHIDFGHFLGHYRKVLGKYVDKADLVLIDQYLAVIGKENFPRFEKLCCQAYNVIRKHANYFITLFSLMLSSGLPELQSADDIKFMKNRLRLDLTDEEATEYFKRTLQESQANSTIQWNHRFHVFYNTLRG